MTTQDNGESRQRRSDATRADPGRAVAFSDAVIAIVITLLVLDLKPPETEPGGMLAALLEQWPTYLAYAASYVYLAVIWLNHKAAFTRIREMDIGLQWANLGILATLALIPWPTAMIAETASTGNIEDERVAVGLYAIIGALLCLAWLVFFAYLARHPDLTKDHVDDSYFARERPRALIGVLLYLAAGAAGILLHPLVASVIFLLLPAFYGFTSHGHDQPRRFLRTRRGPRDGAAADLEGTALLLADDQHAARGTRCLRLRPPAAARRAAVGRRVRSGKHLPRRGVHGVAARRGYVAAGSARRSR